jgi:Acetyltransferase (isoleucine patch superfamily)
MGINKFYITLKDLLHINLWNYYKYNYFSSKVERKGKGKIIPYRYAILDIQRGSKIIINDQDFIVNRNRPKHSHAEAYIRMKRGSVLEISGKVELCYQATIEVHENALISIGTSYINTGAVLLCNKGIKIGNEVLISRHVFIFDDDHHAFLNEQGERINPAKEVIIGDHVWIGLRCTILRGAKIGEGAVIAADSLVGGKINAGTMASGNPARSYSEVKWRA